MRGKLQTMSFPGTTIGKLEQFFRQFKITGYKKKDIILYPDEISNSVFYIKSGFVRAYRISETGDELTLIILKQNDLFPINCGLNNSPNNYYLEAITSLEAYKAPKEMFLAFVKQNPAIFYDLTTNILERFGGLLTRMEYLIISRAYAKVTSTLLVCAQRFGEKQGREVILKVPLTHKDIANLAGITRETTCLEMKKLEKKGLVGRNGRMFVIKNLKALQEESLVEETVLGSLQTKNNFFSSGI